MGLHGANADEQGASDLTVGLPELNPLEDPCLRGSQLGRGPGSTYRAHGAFDRLHQGSVPYAGGQLGGALKVPSSLPGFA